MSENPDTGNSLPQEYLIEGDRKPYIPSRLPIPERFPILPRETEELLPIPLNRGTLHEYTNQLKKNIEFFTWDIETFSVTNINPQPWRKLILTDVLGTLIQAIEGTLEQEPEGYMYGWISNSHYVELASILRRYMIDTGLLSIEESNSLVSDPKGFYKDLRTKVLNIGDVELTSLEGVKESLRLAKEDGKPTAILFGAFNGLTNTHLRAIKEAHEHLHLVVCIDQTEYLRKFKYLNTKSREILSEEERISTLEIFRYLYDIAMVCPFSEPLYENYINFLRGFEDLDYVIIHNRDPNFLYRVLQAQEAGKEVFPYSEIPWGIDSSLRNQTKHSQLEVLDMCSGDIELYMTHCGGNIK